MYCFAAALILVSTHSRPKAAGPLPVRLPPNCKFQHTAARRRLGFPLPSWRFRLRFNTQPPEGGWFFGRRHDDGYARFNTQPPEGGWVPPMPLLRRTCGFNTQPPEGGWMGKRHIAHYANTFQHTAARRRLASSALNKPATLSFQHTAARRRLASLICSPHSSVLVSTHSRPKAAGVKSGCLPPAQAVSTHSRPKAAGLSPGITMRPVSGFQHTAARRRLALPLMLICFSSSRFNTQPPEGGWHRCRRSGLIDK